MSTNTAAGDDGHSSVGVGGPTTLLFVADSRRTLTRDNGESFRNLADNVARVGRNFKNLPLAARFDTRDPHEILSENEAHERRAGAPGP